MHVDELVPGVAAVVEDVLAGFENSVGEPLVTHVLPDDRVELRARRWQWPAYDVFWHHEMPGETPTRLIEEKHGMDAGCPDGHRLQIGPEALLETCMFSTLLANKAVPTGEVRFLSIVLGQWRATAVRVKCPSQAMLDQFADDRGGL